MKNPLFEIPKRAVHLDFHTGPGIPDVGCGFDSQAFADAFQEAHVDSVTLFAMCHHGHLYYHTGHPARHPGLSRDMDLLERQIDALHGVGIRTPIYLSVQCNEYAANEHPEWIALTPELRQVKWGSSAFNAGWQILDMSSPYQDYLAEILSEVLQRFTPVDGIFMDMCWDQPSCSKWAVAGMLKKGYNPQNEDDRAKYARETAHQYMARFRKMVEDAHLEHEPAGVWFNSRPKTNLHIEKKFLRHVEIEALPTGGWGYAYFPYVARFVRPLGLPTLCHTGRFFKNWGDHASLKPDMALKYECCQVLSQGMSVGVGDALHPRGVPQKAVYDLIRRTYSYIEACEPYMEGAKILSQIAVIVDTASGDTPGPGGLGATRALMQLRYQFDILPPDHDFQKYELILIPENIHIDNALVARLKKYSESGGALIVCGASALDELGQPVMEELGILSHGQSEYTHTFLHASGEVSADLPEYGCVMYEPGFRMTPMPQSQSLVTVGKPYFQREYHHFSGHEYTPEDKLSTFSAVVKHGRTVTFSVPILEAYGKHAVPYYRTLLGNCIRLLLPDPLIKDDGPSKLEITVAETDNRMIVHLLSFYPERRAEDLDIVEDAIPVVGLHLSVKSRCRPTRVFLAPDSEDLMFDYVDGYVNATVAFQGGHAMLILEKEIHDG